MTIPTSNQYTISQEDVDRLVMAMRKRGGQVSIQDPRVSKIQTWMIGLVGTGIIVSLGWLANSVDSLNRNFAGLAVWREYVDRRLDHLENNTNGK